MSHDRRPARSMPMGVQLGILIVSMAVMAFATLIERRNGFSSGLLVPGYVLCVIGAVALAARFVLVGPRPNAPRDKD